MTSVCPKDHLLILGEDKGRHLGVGPWMKGVQWQREFNSLVTASLAQSSEHKPRAGRRLSRPGGCEEEDPDGLLHSLRFGFLRSSVYWRPTVCLWLTNRRYVGQEGVVWFKTGRASVDFWRENSISAFENHWQIFPYSSCTKIKNLQLPSSQFQNLTGLYCHWVLLSLAFWHGCPGLQMGA